MREASCALRSLLALLALSIASFAPRGATAVRVSGAAAGLSSEIAAAAAEGNASEGDISAWRVTVRSYKLPFLVGLGYHTETWLCSVGKRSFCYAVGFGMDGASALLKIDESKDAPVFFGDQTLKPERHVMGFVEMSLSEMNSLMERMHSCGNWQGEDYSFLKHNCNSFTVALLRGLGFADDVHPKILSNRLEGHLWGNGRYFGYWSVPDGRCGGNKCFVGTVSSCSAFCDWKKSVAGDGAPADCIQSDGRRLVEAENFMEAYCSMTQVMLPVKQAREDIFKEVPDLKQDWNNKVDMEKHCDLANVDQVYCDFLTCFKNHRVRHLGECCEEHGGWLRCLEETPFTDKCRDASIHLVKLAGLRPWD